MKFWYLNSGRILSMCVQCGIILLCMNVHMEPAASAPRNGNESDRLALLDLKNHIIQDPLGIMNSWNDSIHFCIWSGITCDPSSKRVVGLDLISMKLTGSIPPSVGNLTRLTAIALRDNSFRGEIPQEIGRLQLLQQLNIANNSFGGKLPTNITNCRELRAFLAYGNRFTGSIPVQFGSLSKMEILDLGKNNFTGTIPAWVGNFTSLRYFSVYNNNFQGSIPQDFGHLKGLRELYISSNKLTGVVPSSIYNNSNLSRFSFTNNQLHGNLPPDVGFTLPNLKVFTGGMNKLTGPIPQSLSNCSALVMVDFAANGLTGTLPESLGRLKKLRWISFEGNSLGHRKAGDLDFFKSLPNCTFLEMLALSANNFGGELPQSIANLSSHLSTFNIWDNFIHGKIPNGIENLVSLTSLQLAKNQLEGRVPEEIGMLHKLQILALVGNKFSGSLPLALGNLTSLIKLFLEQNMFEGSIPRSLGNCKNLLLIDLSRNNLSDTIPKEVIGLSSLSILLSLSNNFLTGALPSEVGQLKNLAELDLSENKLSGELPSSLGACVSLEGLHLEGNEFEGAIPHTLKSLRGLEHVDLSCNNLSGLVPKYFGEFSALKHLNLSYNKFEGELPNKGIFLNATGVSIIGNDKLCGGIPKLHLPPCLKEKSYSTRKAFSRKVVIPVICAAGFLTVILCILAGYSIWRPIASSSSTEDWESNLSYSDLFKSTEGFSENNLVGSGSFGSVYKGVLPRDNKTVAIKVLNLQRQGASRSFINECNALRSLRHRNLLKIISACSSIDHLGNDFKSLIFEFMANGNLDQWLHPRDNEEGQDKRLSICQRLNIAIDVASALHYLHHDCGTPIVHCDLKPSNVLLDEDMVSHVSDFGISKLLFQSSDIHPEDQTMSVALRGSIGYIPPEYGMGGQVSTLGDSYSFGILLLELFTGKRPTDDLFKDGISIHQFVEAALPHHVMDIVDPLMPIEEEDDDVEDNVIDIEEVAINDVNRRVNVGKRIHDCLASVMQIGVMCCRISPGERMLMNMVVDKMHAIRDSYLKSKKSQNMIRL